MEFQQCRAAQDGRFDILWGLDEELIGALAVGARGAVGSTYNYAATLYYRMIDAFRAGDLSTAQDCALDSVRLVEQLKEFGTLPGGKALMSLHGVDCGDPLPPVASLAPEKKRELLERVRGLGIIESVAEEAVAGT